MKKSVIAMAMILPLIASCTATERGASIGAGSGAIIGGIATNSWGGAAVGAVGGGVIGALIGKSQERRGYCIYRGRHGHRYEAPCR
ncbi:YMGG-like glycine zipper-containing protein [Allorhizobium terrae]|uniref:Glycine zipper domain-containing protein n=1 Tax=Allorhizobium terrae TaxID=1848972 RepID=A0A4S3ZWY1_9HYPH|nr:glycine zipper domain-containing protein [Allorhizobium terrae]THF50274.1 hypothetical protein E6C51_11085 [Allorhizobium terrae]TWD53282.1 outer membrane protein with glycine zipper [Agrobacterium vitis]